MENTTAALRAIRVSELFGRSSFTVNLDPDKPSILTGANGTGKSTLLKLINAVSSGDMLTLASAPLTALTLEFDGLPSFHLNRSHAHGMIKVEWGDHSENLRIDESYADLPEWARDLLKQNEFDPVATAENSMEYARLNAVAYDEYAEARELLLNMQKERRSFKIPDWFESLRSRFQVLYVTDQRLISESRRASRPTPRTHPRNNSLAVESVAADLSDRIRRADSDYARSSQLQDRQLPANLIDALSRRAEVSVNDLKQLESQVDSRRESLRNVGLLDRANRYENSLATESLDDANVRRVMNQVLLSTLEKLNVLNDLESRLSTFKGFLDSRLSNKTAVLSRQMGIRFEGRGTRPIRARQLSSGEQQLLILAYEILFRASTKTVVIIDEPEMSLHMMWQDSLVADLIRMGTPSHLQFLMATHSPIILADHPEFERPLGDC